MQLIPALEWLESQQESNVIKIEPRSLEISQQGTGDSVKLTCFAGEQREKRKDSNSTGSICCGFVEQIHNKLNKWSLSRTQPVQLEHKKLSYRRGTERLIEIAEPPLILFRLAHLQCESLLFRSPRLSSVCLSRVRSRKLREIRAKCRHPHGKSGSESKNMTSDFASEVAKYPKRSLRPQNSVK